MKPRILLSASVLLLLGSFLLLMFLPAEPPDRPRPRPLSEGEAKLMQKEADRAELFDFELMRLRDPATGRIPDRMRRRELDFARDLPRSTRAAGAGEKACGGWEARGPGNIGGRSRALAVDVSDPMGNTLLAGGVSGGMWRSTDGGDSWARVTPPENLQAVSCLVQDVRPGHENVFYYGTGEVKAGSPSQNGDLYRGDGIWKSVDGGLTWEVLPATTTGVPQYLDQPFDYVQDLAIDPSETTYDEVYAATYGFIYRSIDGGLTWTAVLGDPDLRSRFTDVEVSPTGVVYAGLSADGGMHGVFRSIDGVNWTNISPDYMDDHRRIVIALAPSNENIAYVVDSETDGTTFSGIHKYTYLSGDGSGTGGVWEDRSANLIRIEGTAYSYDTYYTQRGYNQCLAVSPTDPDLVFLGGVDLWRSPDGFATKDGIDVIGGFLDKNHHADVHRIIFQPGSDTAAFTVSDGGIHRARDVTQGRVHWVSLNNGFTTTQFYTVAVDPELPGNEVIVGGTQDNGTLWTGSSDFSAEWTMPLGGDGAHCAVIDAEADPAEYILSYYYGYIFRCQVTERGKLRSQTLLQPAAVGYYDYLFINPWLLDPLDEHRMFLATYYGVWRLDDWREVQLHNPNPVEEGWEPLTNSSARIYVSALGMAAGGDGSLYFGTALGEIYRVPDAANAPAPTTPIPLHDNADFPDYAYVSGIAVHPDDPDRILLCFANYGVESLWYSEDGGASWTDVEGNLAGDDGPSVRAVEIVPRTDGDLWFVGTSIGVFSTGYETGEPVVWELEAADLVGNAIVNAITSRPADGLVVAASHGLGVYSMNLEVEAPEKSLPESRFATSNYPDPFNPQTTIAYELPRGQSVNLRVFDVAGRLVKVLRDGAYEAAGPHQAVWNGTDEAGRAVTSGVYLYLLETDDFSTSRKMTLVR